MPTSDEETHALRIRCEASIHKINDLLQNDIQNESGTPAVLLLPDIASVLRGCVDFFTRSEGEAHARRWRSGVAGSRRGRFR